jgi:hypothetical protein
LDLDFYLDLVVVSFFVFGFSLDLVLDLVLVSISIFGFALDLDFSLDLGSVWFCNSSVLTNSYLLN